jgi:hypothetical protein
LLAVAHRRPLERAEIEHLARAHDDVRASEFAEHAVGERVVRVRAGADLRDREAPVGVVAALPELIVLRVRLPVDAERAAVRQLGVVCSLRETDE